jgi:hypothetical protein
MQKITIWYRDKSAAAEVFSGVLVPIRRRLHGSASRFPGGHAALAEPEHVGALSVLDAASAFVEGSLPSGSTSRSKRRRKLLARRAGAGASVFRAAPCDLDRAACLGVLSQVAVQGRPARPGDAHQLADPDPLDRRHEQADDSVLRRRPRRGRAYPPRPRRSTFPLADGSPAG